MNKQSCFFYSWHLHLALITCMLPLPWLSLCCSDLSFVLVYIFPSLSQCPSPHTSQRPCLQVHPVHPFVLFLLSPLLPMISLLLSFFPFPKCPLILVSDPLNLLSLSDHSYSHACLETYANTHAYTYTYKLPHQHRHSQRKNIKQEGFFYFFIFFCNGQLCKVA